MEITGRPVNMVKVKFDIDRALNKPYITEVSLVTLRCLRFLTQKAPIIIITTTPITAVGIAIIITISPSSRRAERLVATKWLVSNTYTLTIQVQKSIIQQ